MKPTSTITVTIRNKLGLHARPAMMFVDTAKQWPCEIKVRRVDQDEIVDGKSIMFMMMLAATKGAQIEICACGEQAEDACKALKALVDSGFDED
jgi:phosphocarrier protein